MHNLIAKLYQPPKTVLTTKELALLWQEHDKSRLNSKIDHYVKQKTLYPITKGIFAKTKHYDTKELATSIYTPSYISFETILRESGIIFRHYSATFIASRFSKTITTDGNILTFRKLKDSILYNPIGIIIKDNYSIATTERAFLDMIYLFPNYYFDNLHPINFDQCLELVASYDNKQLNKRLNKYYKNYVK
ncbi:MAG: hypothetical protein LBL17_04615 [Coxiellaceae bacterium]|jgi:hypothetical protein|nr:hypothetical protein [Coxiellaceae bacterium]